MAKIASEKKNEVDESLNPKGKKIRFADRVMVKATKKAKHLVEGKVYSLHPELAEKLVKKGAVEIAE